MRKDFRISGSGGQGVVSLAILLANVYGVYENYEVAQTQSYGAAARGGASQAGLVVSDKPIDYIEVDKADVFVAFNEASFMTYYPKTKKDAIIFVDSTLVPKELYADIPHTVYEIPATDIAEHQFKLYMANVVMMGFIAAKLGNISFDSLTKVIADQLPARAYEENVAALTAGYERGKS